MPEGRFHGKTHITTATTTVVSTNGGCLLHCITINGGTAGAVTVSDFNATSPPTATNIAVIETIGATNPVTLFYDCVMAVGIVVVTAAATDLTVVFS